MLDLSLMGGRGRGGIDVYTVLMLHMDGKDAGTAFLDSSAYAHSMTAGGNAQIDTAQSVFGDASGLFDGSSGTVTSAASADWNLGTADFTIDFRLRLSSNKNYNNILQTDTSLNLLVRADSGGHVNFYGNGIGAIITSGWSSALSTGTWYHIAIVRIGNAFTMYLDGTSWATGSSAITVGDSSNGLRVGGQATATNVLNGWLDELRISKGIARWRENFTPPAMAYSG